MPKTNVKGEIDSLTKELEKLDSRKCSLENTARKILKEIATLTDQIEKNECEAERALRDKLERECRERIQCGIERLKQEQKMAQAILGRYEQNLRMKFKMMKGCQHDKQICQCKIACSKDPNETEIPPMEGDEEEGSEESDTECPETISEDCSDEE